MLTYRFFIILFVTILLSACGGSSNDSVKASGNSYYIDATTGADSNDGLSAASPWLTLDKLSASSIQTPAVVYLKRGQTWYEPLILAQSKITIDAYGTGALPVINGSTEVTGWLNIGSDIYSHTFNVTDGQALGNLSENDIMLKFVSWNTDVATTFATAPIGSYSFDFNFNNLSYTLYIKPASLPAPNTYRASLQLRGIYAQDLSDITIRNVAVARISLNGIEFHNCTNCGAEGVTVQRTGGAVIGANIVPSPNFLYAGNGIDFSNNCSNGYVNNVTVSEIFDSCLAIELYKSNSIASDMRLSNAQLTKCGFAGVEVSVLSNQFSNSNSQINVAVIDGVTVDKAGKGWSGRRYGIDGHGLRIVTDAGAGSMTGIQVSDSVVTDSAGDGIKIAGEVGALTLQRIRSSRNDGIGVNVAEPVAAGLRVDLIASIIDNNGGYGFSFLAPSASGFSIYQSTFFDNTSINLAIFSSSGTTDIRNNLFFSSAAMTHIFSKFILSNTTINNNCYNDNINMFGYQGTAYSTVSSFNTASGFDNNSVGNGMVGMVDPVNDDFHLTTASSCLALGDVSVGIVNDFDKQPYSTPPSSGAFQF